MTKRKTHFEQVPLEVARKIAAEEVKRKEVRVKNPRIKRTAGGGHVETGIVASEGASLR
jgi:hypothetical protein